MPGKRPRARAVAQLLCLLLACLVPSNGSFSQSAAPQLQDLVDFASQPLVADWLSPEALKEVAGEHIPCLKVVTILDFIVQRLHDRFVESRGFLQSTADLLVQHAFNKPSSQSWFGSEEYRVMLHPVIDMHRTSCHFMEFVQVLQLVHGERCFFPALRNALAPAVQWLSRLSKEVHLIQLSTIYQDHFAMWDSSTDVLRHMMPIYNVLGDSAKFADSFSEVRITLDQTVAPQLGQAEVSLPPGAVPPWHDEESGAFSDMNFIYRNMTDAWHLDYGLAASLLRLWSPPEGWRGADESGWHTSIADFGAGGGHYCKYFNQTGEFACNAFDGSSRAGFHTGGLVQTQRLDEPFDLEKRFDWLLCLEVVEHIPPLGEATALANLRRHARIGMVFSWSQEAGEIHPNAKTWLEAQKAVEAQGFALDEAASARLQPRVSWLKGAVHVFRTV